LKSSKKNKKVLIITYYWPPSGGAGVQRWLKFSKYLPEFGWEPIIFTPENPDVPVEDNTLLEEVPSMVEVLKIPIFEPSRVATFLGGNFTNTRMGASNTARHKTSIIHEWISWVRGNLFIPDARVTWVKPAVKFINRWMNDQHIDAIITTGPPHSMHLIGLGVKKNHPDIKWISDFRDPWSDMDYLDDFKMGKRAKKKLLKMEKTVVKSSDKIIITSPSVATTLLKNNHQEKSTLIQNGWDSFDFKDVKILKNKSVVFKIGHFGSLYGSRNVPGLWRAVKKWNQLETLKLEIHLVGSVSDEIKLELKNDTHVKFTPSLPHQQSVIEMSSCNALLLVQNATDAARKCTPGKVFEYIACGKPILSICNSPSDLASQLKNWGLPFCDHDDEDAAYEMLQEVTNKDGQQKIDPSPYERRTLTKKLVDELNRLTQHS
jgi:glycosyltransferase involved in cell wall biosynthesis